jgi:bifunctional DNase/RNase
MTQDRLVVLKDTNTDRFLPIWIGPCEADAITAELQQQPIKRPLTHDLLKNVIHDMGGHVVHIFINELRNDVYYARILIDVAGKQVEVDSRPSDAIALGVRVKVPIFVAESVMDRAAILEEEDIENETTVEATTVGEEKLSAFADFLDSLDLDDLEDNED